MDEHAGLGVLGGQDVAVDGHPPTLVAAELGIPVEPVDKGGQLRAEEEDIHAAELGDLIEEIRDGFLQLSFRQVRDQVPFDINRGASLRGGEKSSFSHTIHKSR